MFETLKQHYYKICVLKGDQAYRVASGTFAAWRVWSTRKAVNRYKHDQIYVKVAERVCRSIMAELRGYADQSIRDKGKIMKIKGKRDAKTL